MIRSSFLIFVLVVSIATSALTEETSPLPPGIGPRLQATNLFGSATTQPLRYSLSISNPDNTRNSDLSTTAAFSLNRYGTFPTSQLYRPRLYKLSRFQCAMKGAGAGTSLGLFAGALARNFNGNWNMNNSWHMAGAAAAAGALLGGTLGAENSKWNVGVDWSAGGKEYFEFDPMAEQ